MNDVWIQLIVTIGTVLGAAFVTIRYAANNNRKKDKAFLDYLENSQNKQLEYYEQKNGHLERISLEFSKAINKNTRAVEKLISQKK